MPLRKLLVLLPLSVALAQEPPRTTPEATAHQRTSSVGDVDHFLQACTKLAHGARLTITPCGTSHEGRPLQLVRIADPAVTKDRVRVLVIGNIHAGEIEGKEALQALVREFALGEHGELLQHCDLALLPIYNPDGNEQLGSKNRAGQNGPDLAGQRPNGQGLDLNRDFVKADAPETRALLGLFSVFDPHVFVDLHTTNGSYHGYHLTYAPCLSPNQDPALQRWSRSLLDECRAAMQKEHGFATFDYGNFETRDWEQNGAPESPKGQRGWYTYDHRPRYGVNYFGLRNRIAVLSEAYSYADFATRIAATRAFVLTILQRCAARDGELLAALRDADARAKARTEVALGYGTGFAPAVPEPVLVGEVDTIAADGERPERHVRKGDGKPETMPVCRAFQASKQQAVPSAWLVLSPSADVVDRLRWHGVQFTVLERAETVPAARFAVTAKTKRKRPYQGHQELELGGSWEPVADVEVPAGSLRVPAAQPLARLAAVLLEPQSEDSLSTWNFFEATTTTHYPVLRQLGR